MANANPVRPPEVLKSHDSSTGFDEYLSAESKSALLADRFIHVNGLLLKEGFQLEELKHAAKCLRCPSPKSPLNFWLIPLFAAILLLFILESNFFDGMVKSALSVKCVVPNNYIVWEATRPVTDCRICHNLTTVLELNNVSRSQFKPHAYSYQPIVVKGAALRWPAMETFDYDFFKRLYETVPDAYKSVEEDCQFLNFKSNFSNLKDVFSMPLQRVSNGNNQPWYIGWSNCHSDVLKEMRKHYSKPHFLPEEAEHSHIDFIFMGYQQGAFMHLDYISRLMWQAQLKGRKVWRLTPPPECESSCSTLSFIVSPGDILLLDTRQWYHDTYILDEEFSITVSSEYG